MKPKRPYPDIMKSLQTVMASIRSTHCILAKKIANHILRRCLQTSVCKQSLVACELSSRGILRLEGRDTSSFLQGLVTNDINLLMENAPSSQYCMMLNVQGRVLYDLFLYNITQETSSAATLLVDVDVSVKQEFMKILKRYKLRKKVDIADVSDEYSVWSRFRSDNAAFADTTVCSPDSERKSQYTFTDPRIPTLAHRVVTLGGKCEDSKIARCEDYRIHRYKWGVPEGVGDLPPGKCLPLESNLALMNGVNFNKGCYIGQELTARTYHTGVTRKRLLPILLDKDQDVELDAKISTLKGRNAGKFRNREGVHGLGLLRLANLKESLSIGNVTLTCSVPFWWPANALNADPTS